MSYAIIILFIQSKSVKSSFITLLTVSVDLHGLCLSRSCSPPRMEQSRRTNCSFRKEKDLRSTGSPADRDSAANVLMNIWPSKTHKYETEYINYGLTAAHCCFNIYHSIVNRF